jgi:CheY-like chemotaxis protein
MVDRNFGKFSKASQIGERMQTKEDADKQFKLAVACVWCEWLRNYYDKRGANIHNLIPMDSMMPIMDGFGMSHYNLQDYQNLELDHIRNKTHGDRYNLLNVQLITPETHDIKTKSGEYTDYRYCEYVKWLKEKLK